VANRDILIVGGGLAGLFLALKLAPRRCSVS
jgi:2-polyprenyl-6-methoxyphenol hydroxylase-like FAD-dependent oxidoreductase